MNPKFKAFVLLAVLYGLGVLSGIAWQSAALHRPRMMRPFFAEHRLKKLTAQLHLSPVQQQSVRDIFDQAHRRATQVNEEVAWDLADIHHDSVAAIWKVLTPEQQQAFAKLHHQFHTRHKQIVDDDLPVVSSSTARAHP